MEVLLRQTSALRELHPNRSGRKYRAQARVCEWMEKILFEAADRRATKADAKESISAKAIHIAAPPTNYQLGYTVRSKEQVIQAKKREALLVMGYRLWLEEQGRKLPTSKIGNLQCDGYEEKRRNLIEAKSSTAREHLRMAVGQLLGYSFEVGKEYGKPNLAILLPSEPKPSSVAWLQHLAISVIWREKGSL